MASDDIWSFGPLVPMTKSFGSNYLGLWVDARYINVIVKETGVEFGDGVRIKTK